MRMVMVMPVIMTKMITNTYSGVFVIFNVIEAGFIPASTVSIVSVLRR